MSESNARYLPALLGAGVSIFVGLSVLMGRIYFQKYAEILGILESDFRLTAIDYALFSPDVTIVALGMAALTAACLWGLIWSHDRISWNGRYIIGGGGRCCYRLRVARISNVRTPTGVRTGIVPRGVGVGVGIIVRGYVVRGSSGFRFVPGKPEGEGPALKCIFR